EPCAVIDERGTDLVLPPLGRIRLLLRQDDVPDLGGQKDVAHIGAARGVRREAEDRRSPDDIRCNVPGSRVRDAGSRLVVPDTREAPLRDRWGTAAAVAEIERQDDFAVVDRLFDVAQTISDLAGPGNFDRVHSAGVSGSAPFGPSASTGSLSSSSRTVPMA